ncbi:unnamed protein product [Mesocestoides corti]|uniref:Uncharacterized protein n=1 Tax=Mesocestoides corti TaxID=53468 RepID=A0A0R3UR51_MESCO|nr:unnamed protein product [Mesocestoides corti]
MRLTDRQVRFYLHHALGFFDRRWHGWHRLEVRLNRHGGAHSNPYSTTPVVPRVEIRFSVDQKTNRGYMKAGDVLWLDWAEFKSRGYLQKDAARQFYSNEAFLGLPPAGTMSEYAVGTLIKYRDVIQRHLSADNDTTLAAKSAVAFRPFQGGIKSFLIASECACGLSKQFGPRMVQIGAGVAIQSVCDVRSLPPLNANYSGVCKSKVNESTCGCVGFGNRHVCYCPGSCNALKVHGSTSTRVALLDNAVPAPNLLEESKLLVSNDRDQSNAYLSENPSTYKQMDSCFSNIFLCEEPVTYQFWMFIDPAAVLTGATRILKHASHPNSPWYLEVVYQGIPKLEAPTVERIMQLTVELRAPPHFNWMIDRCESDLRATPDQWHQIRIHWNKRNLSLFIDDTICGVAGTNISTIKATSDQRFATRRTAYVFLGAHTIQDFTFNGQRLQRTFYRSTYFTNAIGEIEPVSRNLSDDFYVAFQLNTSKSVASVRLPGINVTSVNAKGILVVSSEHGDCIVFHQPVNCLSSAPCHVEVERTHDIINVYSQNSLLRVSSVNSEECSIARRSPTESGLAPNTEVRLFSRDRRELLKRRLIMTSECVYLCLLNRLHCDNSSSPFPVLECNFDDVPRTFKDAIQDPSTICAPSQAFPNIQVQSLDGPLESAVQDTLMVSSSRLAVTTSDTAPESVCLRDIQLCQFGLTTSFWVLHLPASASPRSWPIYRLEGPSGSRMRVYLTKTATEYRLETTVMSLESIIAGKAVSRVWKVAVAVNSIDQNWVHVTTSWSHSAGLSVKVNGTIVATSREPFEESADWELPSLTGLLLGYNRQPDQEEGVVIDDFQFIPAELNHLASVGQTIDRKLSNQGLEICRHHTCLEGSTCFPMQHATTSRGNLYVFVGVKCLFFNMKYIH